MDMSFSKLQEMARTGKPGMLWSTGSQNVGDDLATTTTNKAQKVKISHQQLDTDLLLLGTLLCICCAKYVKNLT